MASKKTVFLNASVLLAGLASPSGGSAKILKWIKQGKMRGVISEVVLAETMRHLGKIGVSGQVLDKNIKEMHLKVCKAPTQKVREYQKIAKDPGDIHLLVSACEQKAHYLISLDKKHVLSLAGKIKDFQIHSPGEFILRSELKH